MTQAKIAITLEESLVRKIDHLVSDRFYPNRSKAIQAAVQEKLSRLGKGRLARECAKLDPAFEKSLAEEGISGELKEWPEY